MKLQVLNDGDFKSTEVSSGIQNEEIKRRKDDEEKGKVGQRKCWNTEYGVILSGEGCNIPVKLPSNICNF